MEGNKRYQKLLVLIIFFISTCLFSCVSEKEIKKQKGPIETSPKLLPPEKIVQSKHWDEIKLNFQKVTEGMTKDQCISLLGTPQWDKEDGIIYLERPGQFGTMEYFKIELRKGKVQRTEKNEISVDPW